MGSTLENLYLGCESTTTHIMSPKSLSMEKDHFFKIYFEQEATIELIGKRAGEIHQLVNQTYGGYLPYEFHLRLTASYVIRYAHLLPITEDDIQTLYAAAYFHDTLEDARLTYHD